MKLHEQQLEALCSSTTTSDIEARCKLEESFLNIDEQQLEALCYSTTTSDIEARCKLEESFLNIDDHETMEEKRKSAGNTVRYLSALYIMYRVYVYKNGI